MSLSTDAFAKISGQIWPPSTDRLRERLLWLAGLKLSVIDLFIALARKVAGFCALLTLGWIYFRILVLGASLHQVYPTSPDPDLRHALWVALLLVLAQGWDIPTEQLAEHWKRLRSHVVRPDTISSDFAWNDDGALSSDCGELGLVSRLIEPVVIHLGRFMDLCVAVANKVGAFAIFIYLLFLAEQFGCAGETVRKLYPTAQDPAVSFLVDMCVYIVVLGWWATPVEQIRLFWRRLRPNFAGAPSEV